LHSTLHFTRCLRIFLFGEKRRRVAAVLTIDYWGLDAILVQHPYPHHWFNSEGGHYEYLIMRYGLTYASAVFQSFFNEIFKDLLNLCVIVYIEDILIYSKDYSTHVSHVCLVLNQLLEHHLFVKAENCEFHQKIIIFFGYIISNMEVEMDTSKRAFFERLDINESLTSSCHPQSNGQVESLNQELGRYLRTYCHKEQLRWSEFLPWAEYAQNSLTHTSSELTLDDWFHQSQEVWESAH
ncbi:hypothetical protein QTP70_031736, partial [Hemibagrus guttatus]